MEPAFYNSGSFVESARRLAATDPAAWEGIVAAREYLRDFGRAAVAPDVRWHIAQSDFAEHCGELRWPNPEHQSDHPDVALRALFVAHPSNEWYVFTVLGNKATRLAGHGDWCDVAVAQSDRIVRDAIAALELAPLPTK